MMSPSTDYWIDRRVPRSRPPPSFLRFSVEEEWGLVWLRLTPLRTEWGVATAVIRRLGTGVNGTEGGVCIPTTFWGSLSSFLKAFSTAAAATAADDDKRKGGANFMAQTLAFWSHLVPLCSPLPPPASLPPALLPLLLSFLAARVLFVLPHPLLLLLWEGQWAVPASSAPSFNAKWRVFIVSINVEKAFPFIVPLQLREADDRRRCIAPHIPPLTL